MKKILHYLLLPVLLIISIVGCNRRAVPIAETRDTSVFQRDSVVITYVTKDDSVMIIVPRDSIIFKDSIPCKDVIYSNKYKTKSLYASVTIRNGYLEVDCRTDSLLSVLARTRDSITTIRASSAEKKVIRETKTYKVEVPKPYIPWFFWVCAAIVVAFVVIKIYTAWPSISGTAINLVSKLKR